jgi:hypothetical protein
MRQRVLTAVAAYGEIGAVEFPVCAALIAAGLGVTSFGSIQGWIPELRVNELR